MKFLLELWRMAIYFLFPPRCPNCREMVDERYQLCAACGEKIFCVDFYSRPSKPIDKVLRVTRYRNGSKELLTKLKFDNNLKVVPALQKILDDVADRAEVLELLSGVDRAVPVPLHEGRFKERGFNQTEKIFADWLAAKNLPLENILIRRLPTPRLFDMNRAEREKILTGAFAAVEPVDLRGESVLIVDDIFTTGTTCRECAKVLKSLGAKKISALAFAADFDDRLKEQRDNVT